jgi:CheY-like chemotaxis protein
LTALRTGSADPTRTYALVTVADSGSGMDAATLKHIFEPFYTTKPHGQGTGLGLAVVDGIVLSLGGVYAVESKPGAGTKFSVYLPLEEAITPMVPAKSASRLRILVIDDQTAIADAIAMALERLGFESAVVDDPLEALAAFAENPHAWDVVITDENMPKMRGSVLIAELRALRPLLPIILCTGLDAMSEAAARARGANGYVAKPVDPARLAGVIASVVQPAGVT